MLMGGGDVVTILLYELLDKSWKSRGEGQEHGPVFLTEPPARLLFSNSSGASVTCGAHAVPPPQLTWLLPDGSAVEQLPGISDNYNFVYGSEEGMNAAGQGVRAAERTGCVRLARTNKLQAPCDYQVEGQGFDAFVGSGQIGKSREVCRVD
ncbi:Down syndrome cell adhesion molecule-like protein Dscam2 [Eumeta japonica]|uniref:Down syndrome cell adhesion molecule-like protein Dscam2 n=1 Tax=Eumeta variegata TaxID=151549 RepID=A0A4C1SAW9_EUMVA|nr:Down syndrome cell adhesion molecule-like protein Dscam2 [Eumeta japonica]